MLVKRYITRTIVRRDFGAKKGFVPTHARNRVLGVRAPWYWRLWSQQRTFCAVPSASKKELQGELDQPRIGPRRRSGDDTKILVVGRAADGIWRGKLSSIEKIEKLRSELKAQPLIDGEFRSFEYGEVEIIDPLGA